VSLVIQDQTAYPAQMEIKDKKENLGQQEKEEIKE
jgi:hypothetical protein